MEATRAAALTRLAEFLPRAGWDYARNRNRDVPGLGAVSSLSPYLRHRLVTEEQVVAAAYAMHGHAADKFVAEVYWRTYWKGWLEMRPSVWRDYQAGVLAGLNRVAVEGGLRRDWEAACAGTTGIDAFDHWAQELASTGYLHNHARMWFASIWIFTLRLPWELGADFFLRHLLDGDVASNTCSWRWVGGLHTPGKTYLATADNIAKNTDGRFAPKGLATTTFTLTAPPVPTPKPIRAPDDWDRSLPSALLTHDDDCHPDFILDQGVASVSSYTLLTAYAKSPLTIAPNVATFSTAAIRGAAATDQPPDIAHILASGAAQILTPYAPTGPNHDALHALEVALKPHNIPVIRVMREYDRTLWPNATHGFFRFREAVT
jgi:deoxyribodipyrimidine photo-lyase